MSSRGKPFRSLAIVSTLFFYLYTNLGYADSIQVPSTIAVKSHKSLLVNSATAGDRIFTVGGRGHILYSDDQGNSWVQANSPTQMLLTAIDFVDDQNGWAVGHDSVILGTHDGGENWNLLFEAPDLEKPLLDVVFFDKKNGLVTGAYGLIMRTHDGGKTWQDFMIGELDWHFNSILRVGEHVLIAGEAGTLVRSSDQGKTWTQLESPYVGSFFGAITRPIENGHQIIVYGLRGHAFVSNDLGDNWTQLDTGVTTNLLGGTYTVSGDTILLGAGGTILRKNKGDTNFQRVPYSGFENLTSVIAINDSDLVVFGVRGTAKLKAN
ncbi:MAG: YCF48-related protein [Pseudomonadales bacterium]|nr:YCF48-related protein [Pseudomonadales bacterium]